MKVSAYFSLLILFLTIFSCSTDKKNLPKTGIWVAELDVMNKQVLPFNFKILKSEKDVYSIEIYNAEEVILVDEIFIHGDSIKIKAPVFEGYIAARFTENSMKGRFVKENQGRTVPFSAYYGSEERFRGAKASKVNLDGIWEVDFDYKSEDTYKGKGIFSQKDDVVTGTFRTPVGDYRYLEGVVDGDSLKITSFDGAHAFLFAAKATDSTLNGVFYSDNVYAAPFIANKNPEYKLANSDSLTYLKKGFDKVEFSFPDETGKIVSLSDEQFKDMVVLVQIMGTWCPNCLDETKFYVDYLKQNPDSDIKIIGLAFEYAKTQEKAVESIQRLRDRIGADYPILIAQLGTDNKKLANEKLPMLNQVLSYPTTIYIDKKGAVRKIHTGFNGPATGAKYKTFKNEFDVFVKGLLEE